jgi:flavodoxin I
MSNTLILFGSTTGNTETVAEQIKQNLPDATLANANEFEPNKLSEFENLIIGSSTWDEGELQYDMADLLVKLETEKPDLSKMQVFIFALGDEYYDHFCASGEILKTKLENFGATITEDILKINGMPDDKENQTALKAWMTKLKDKLT